MPWKNQDGDISETRPTRVRLPNAETRTSYAVTDEVLAEAGWYWEEPPVIIPEPITLSSEQTELVLESPVVEILANSSGSFNDYFEISGNITSLDQN